MLDFLKKRRLLISLLVVFITLQILMFQRGRNSDNSTIQAVSQTLTYPFQSILHSVVNFTSEIAHSYFYLVQLQEENQKLRSEISSLKEEIDRYIEESIQYNRLKVQLEFAETNPDRKVFAEVIGESIDNFHKTLQINRGREHGIRRNYAVILREGVVGRIQAVTRFQSTVQLVLDQRSQFPAIVQRTRSKGVVYGDHDGLELRRIHLRADLKPGDRVVTNGLSGLYPKGLLVGIVEKVEHEDHELFQTAKVTPIVDFDKIEGVFVILDSVTQDSKPLFSEEAVEQ